MNEKVQLAATLYGMTAPVINMLPLGYLENSEADCYVENTSFTGGSASLLFYISISQYCEIWGKIIILCCLREASFRSYP